jgi:hypothetical protein
LTIGLDSRAIDNSLADVEMKMVEARYIDTTAVIFAI